MQKVGLNEAAAAEAAWGGDLRDSRGGAPTLALQLIRSSLPAIQPYLHGIPGLEALLLKRGELRV